YAHARICRMLGKFAEEGITLTKIPSEKLTYTDEAELAVIRKIAALPDTVNEAAAAYNPSRITRYVYELAQLFHKFYDSCKIKGEADDVVMSRLALCTAVKTVIKNLLDLLKVDAPEKM
ncbi:MAG: arginine--tRNA ligase, partial [Ruminiclostridium sp.]|nr:arginine--tRNA ligase [Ruminiclostridium sp.]